MLTTLVVLLAAATIAVPLTRRAGFGSVLGYLLAGIVIGPGGLRLITDVDAIASIAEPRRGDAAVPDRPGGPAAAPVGHAARGVRSGHGAGGDHRRGAGGARARHRHRLAGRGRARRRPRDVLHRDRAADAGRARPAHHAVPAATRSPCCCSRTSRSSRWSHWCRCWRATRARPRPLARRGACGGGHRRHPDRRALPAATAVPRRSAGRRRRRCSPPSRC